MKLWVSVVFAVARCLSIRHVGVLYQRGWRHHQTSSPASSPITLVFDPGTVIQFQGEPLQTGCKIQGVGKLTISAIERPLTSASKSLYITSWISQKLRDKVVLGTKLLYNTNGKPYQIYRMVPLSMTLSDLTIFFDIEYVRNDRW